ncbi:MAG: UbiD family decarboxylase [Chloroflexi bacterium]|nr:UbiD family decarboxylase [Chloroflexota bacterium]
MPFDDLPAFLSYLEERGDLVRIKKEVDLKYEISAYIRKTSDIQGPALIFEKVKGFHIPVAGGVFATRDRAILALEATRDTVIERFLHGIQNPIPPRLLTYGPCKEVIHKGEDVDLTSLPIPIYSAQDSGAYITVGVQISKDPETGIPNAGIYRQELKGKNRLGIQSPSWQHLGVQCARAEALNKPLEVAVAHGCDPVILIASQWRAPYGIDEMEVAGGLRGKAVELVKCETVDLEVPATSEIVIEGIIPPHQREMEGPFGEFSGYYCRPFPKPIMEVTCITHKGKPIYLAGLTGVPTTENHVLKEIPYEASFTHELRQKFPSVVAVSFPPAGGCGYLAVIAMKPTSKYESRNVLTLALASTKPKLAITVDDDIDIHDMEKVLWAVTTRARMDEDVIIIPRLAGAGLDPSAKEWGTTTGMGIDATRPFGEPFPDVVTVPGVENVPDFW